MNKVKPLSLRETTLKEEMKSRCLQKGQYIDENAKEKFDMLCHLEDFEVQYFELLSQVEKLTQENEHLKNIINVYENPNDVTKMFMYTDEITQDTINKLNERIGYLERSNNRKEETIIDLRMEQELDKYKSVIDKAIKYLKEKEDSLFMTFDDELLSHDELIDKKIGLTLLEILRSKE